MILSKRISLGNQQLDTVDPSIVIRSIEPGTPKKNVMAVDRMYGNGQRITGVHWQTLETKVHWAMDIPKRDMSERRRVFDAVAAWANRKGWLEVGWMNGIGMYVDDVTFDDAGDLWNWTNEYTITFKAYNVPFWQELWPYQFVGIHTAAGQFDYTVKGCLTSVMDIEIQNISGMTIQDIKIEVRGAVSSNMWLQNVGLGGYDTLYINHGANGILRILDNYGNSKLSCMNVTSTDDLYIAPGTSRILFGVDRAVEFRTSVRGRYL